MRRIFPTIRVPFPQPGMNPVVRFFASVRRWRRACRQPHRRPCLQLDPCADRSPTFDRPGPVEFVVAATELPVGRFPFEVRRSNGRSPRARRSGPGRVNDPWSPPCSDVPDRTGRRSAAGAGGLQVSRSPRQHQVGIDLPVTVPGSPSGGELVGGRHDGPHALRLRRISREIPTTSRPVRLGDRGVRSSDDGPLVWVVRSDQGCTGRSRLSTASDPDPQTRDINHPVLPLGRSCWPALLLRRYDSPCPVSNIFWPSGVPPGEVPGV